MVSHTNNIILIGMAGAGKSTVGSLLADRLGFTYTDTDHIMEAVHGKPLQKIVDALGHDSFKVLEKQTVLDLEKHQHVIATGGSVVYYTEAMAHLKTIGTIVWLDIDLTTLENRVGRQKARGLVGKANQSFGDLYRERLPLYRQYADIRINCSHCTPEEMVQEIAKALSVRFPSVLKE